MSDAISVGPSLDILEDAPETPIVEVTPAASSEETPETPTEETPTEETPTEETPSEDGEKPDGKPKKMGQEPEPEEGSEEETSAEVEAIDVAKFSEEFFNSEDGTLSDESYAELEARGLGRDIVDTFMAGIEALQTQRGEALHTLAGGQEEYDSLVAYGAKNLTAEQRDAFDKAVDQAILEGDTTAVSLLIPGIKAKMSSEPNYVDTDTPDTDSGPQPYANKSEMMADMRKPEYRKDAAFVAQVQQRLAVSTF